MIKTTVDSATALAGLKLLSAELKIKAVQAGLRRPGSAVANQMRSLVPSLSGRLNKSITSRQLSRSAGARIGVNLSGAAAVLIGPNKKVRGRSVARYFHLVESGTRSHIVRGNEKGFSRTGRNTGFSGDARHPGARAKPFVERSLTSVGAGQIEALFYQGLAAHLDKLKK